MGTSAAKCLSLLLAAPIHLRSALRGRAGLPPLCTFCSLQLRARLRPVCGFGSAWLSRPQSRRWLYRETTQLPLLCSLQLSDICLLIFVLLLRTAAGKIFPPAMRDERFPPAGESGGSELRGWFGWRGCVNPPQKALQTPQPPALLALCAPPELLLHRCDAQSVGCPRPHGCCRVLSSVSKGGPTAALIKTMGAAGASLEAL